MSFLVAKEWLSGDAPLRDHCNCLTALRGGNWTSYSQGTVFDFDVRLYLLCLVLHNFSFFVIILF